MMAGLRDAARSALVRIHVAALIPLGMPLAATAATDAKTPPASSQTPAPAASPSPSPVAASGITLPPPPDASNPTPEHVALARRLILATGVSRSFTVMIGEFMDQIGNSVTQERPDLIQDMHAVLDQLRPEFDRQSDEMIDASARIYARLLSEKDIDTILAFYDSEAGKRYVALQPDFLNQLIPGTQAWQQKIASNMMSRVRAEMKKKGHDL